MVEERFWSEAEGAVVEAWDRTWREPEAYRGANANMHMVEALMAAGDATGDAVWYDRALRIAARLVDSVARAAGVADRRALRRRLAAAAGVQRGPAATTRSGPTASRPATARSGRACSCSSARRCRRRPAGCSRPRAACSTRAFEDGWHAPGGFVYTTDARGRPVVTDRLHWVVCEAIGAAAVLHAVTGEAAYEQHYRTAWDFAALHLIDRRHGSWHAGLDDELRPSTTTWSGKPDVYHALQATLLPRLPVAPSLARALALTAPAGAP